jgi:membrane-bound ClpP family serine protease
MLAREVNKACEEELSSLEKGLMDVERDSISKALWHIDIEKNQLNSRTSIEEAQTTIQQLKQVDLIQINKWIVNPSLQLQAISLEERKIQDRLPHIENKLYIF